MVPLQKHDLLAKEAHTQLQITLKKGIPRVALRVSTTSCAAWRCAHSCNRMVGHYENTIILREIFQCHAFHLQIILASMPNKGVRALETGQNHWSRCLTRRLQYFRSWRSEIKRCCTIVEWSDCFATLMNGLDVIATQVQGQ